MEINFKILSLVISCPFWSWIFIKYMDDMYERKYKYRFLYELVKILFAISLLLINLMNIPILNTVYSLFSIMIFTRLLYKPYGKAYLIYNSYFILLMVFMDIISVLLIVYFLYYKINSLIKDDVLMFLTNIPVLMITPIVLQGLEKVLKRQKLDEINVLESIVLIIKVIFEIFVITYIAHLIGDKHDNFGLILISIGFVVGNYFQIKFLNYASNYKSLKQKNALYEHQKLIARNQYKELKIKYDETKKIIHDINKHMTIMGEFYKAGDSIAAAEYGRKIDDKLHALTYGFSFKNKIIEILINDKYILCKSYGIHLIVNVQDIEVKFIEDYDLTIILGNLLDNALEACRSIDKKEKKEIEIRIYEFNSYFIIQILNTAGKVMTDRKESFISTKKKHFGIGISNVKEAVKKYDGDICLESKENLFIAKIIIPAPVVNSHCY